MKRATRPIVVSMVPVLILFVIITVLTGCTSAAKQKEAYWNSQIGQARYNDVVAQLGPPVAKETLSDGSMVAKWVRTSYGTTRSIASSDNWTEELVLRFSPGGLLTQSSLHEY
ncbi:MAG TPA: hypothetical protein VF827_03970 [Syntrophales bacterium]